MHLIKDENGNVIPHGHDHVHEHDHEHMHEHDCSNCQKSEGECKNETVALLTYMLKHNEQHAAELVTMAANIRKMGMEDAAKQIEEGVSDFEKGNMRLSLALTCVKEQLKEG